MAAARPSDGPLPTPEATLRALLKGRGEYHTSTSPVAVAPFKLERISVPESLHGSPDAMSLLDPEARRYLEGEEHMLKENLEEVEDIKPYWDPRLTSDKERLQILDPDVRKIRLSTIYSPSQGPCRSFSLFGNRMVRRSD